MATGARTNRARCQASLLKTPDGGGSSGIAMIGSGPTLRCKGTVRWHMRAHFSSTGKTATRYLQQRVPATRSLGSETFAQSPNRRRATGSRASIPVHRISNDGSGTVELLVVENRLVSELIAVVVFGVLPPFMARSLVTVSEPTGGNVPEHVSGTAPQVGPIVITPPTEDRASPWLTCGEVSATLINPFPVLPAPAIVNTQSSMEHPAQDAV